MKIRLSTSVSVLASLALVLVLHSCANIVRPNGGPRDTEGPEIIGTVPAPGTLNFEGKTIDFHFDEFLKPGNYSKEVFISPVLDRKPSVTVKNKRLRIEFREPLRDSTTYVITLGKEIKDFNEGNKMSNSFTYAFSTGNQLDSLKVTGRVLNAWTTESQEGIKLFLFPEEEIEGNNIFEERPVYATETDKDGNFSLEYLKEGRYKLYGIGDKDGSYSYNNEQEMIALMEDPLIDLSDTLTLQKSHTLYAFFQDREGPQVRSAKWSNSNTIHLQLTEPIRTTFGTDTLAITVSDTFGKNPQSVYLARTKYRSPTDIYLHSPLPNTESIDLSLKFLMDTLGTFTDTVVRIDPQMIVKEEQESLFEPPVFQIEKDRIMVLSYFQLPSSPEQLHVELVDTSDNKIDLDVENYGFEMSVQLASLPEPNMPYTLKILPEFEKADGSTLDSLVEFNMLFPSVDKFGSVSGKISEDSIDTDPKWVMLFMGAPPQDANAAPKPSEGASGSAKRSGGRKSGAVEILKRFDGPGPYELYRVAEGKYAVKYIRDTDGNGYFSPGSLDPYFMPEKVFIDPTAFEVKAKWNVEGFNLFPSELQRNVESGKVSGKGEGKEGDKEGKGRTRTGR